MKIHNTLRGIIVVSNASRILRQQKYRYIALKNKDAAFYVMRTICINFMIVLCAIAIVTNHKYSILQVSQPSPTAKFLGNPK